MNTGNFWRGHKLMTFLTLAVFMSGALLFAFWRAGFRVNLTPSLPMGIYRLTKETPQRGDLVCFCLASTSPFSRTARERGYLGYGSCPSGLRPLLKHLAGLPGDQVTVRPEGLILNDKPLANTARSERDRYGREVPPSNLIEGPIPEGFGLVVSQEHSGSFDSRYFGFVPLASLKQVKPILLKEF